MVRLLLTCSWCLGLAPLAPERSAAQLSACAERLAPAFGARGSDAWHARRLAAIDASSSSSSSSGAVGGADRDHLVYGEMQLETLAAATEWSVVRCVARAFLVAAFAQNTRLNDALNARVWCNKS